MDLRIFTEPQQGATYDQLLTVALTAERLGYGAFFRSDHYVVMGDYTDGLPGPTDAWITLAGLARDTSTIRLGTLLTAATFRLPGPLAISVAQVDQMSAGRVELGLGAGWFDREHAAYGIAFPPVADRFDILAEQLEIVTGLWATPLGQTYTFHGSHYDLVDSPALPKPVGGSVPIIVGGHGKTRTPALAARFATEFNVPFAPLADAVTQYGRVRAACEAAGRDASELVYSAAQIVICGRDEAEIARRAAAVGREVAELRENGLAGTPDEVVEKLRAYADGGAQRMYLQILDLADLEHLELVAAEVMPNV